MFVARHEELAALEHAYQQTKSSLVVVYGRRRLGKTALCTEFAKDKNALYFLATQESDILNRRRFQQAVAQHTGSNVLAQAQFDRWEPLFQVLAETPGKDKLVLILDEFQYLGKANPAFPSILQTVWDQMLSKRDIMIILCGSLVRMMREQTLNYSSPLYGRRTAQIRLRQIPFAHYREFFPTSMPMSPLIPLYSITGGVPKYIETLMGSPGDIYTCIRHGILDRSSYLYEEPYFLLQNEVADIGSYFSLISAIAVGNSKLAAIARNLDLKSASLTPHLKVLRDLDILRRDVPITEKNPEKSKSGLYRIHDNFLRFWFRFVAPNQGYIETGHADTVMEIIRQDLVGGHVARVFEEICREWTWLLAAQDFWSFPIDRVGAWWNKNTEIDVMAISESTGNIVFGECKYWAQPVGMQVFDALRQKAFGVPWHREDRKEHYALFSASGFSPELEAFAQASPSLSLFSLDELFCPV